MEKFHILNDVYNFAAGDSFWFDTGGQDMKKLSIDTMRKNYEICPFKYCLTMENGFVSRCSRATVSHYIQGFSLTEKDGFEIRHPFNTKHLLLFAHNSQKWPVTACYYCNGSNGSKIMPAEQMTAEEYQNIKYFLEESK